MENTNNQEKEVNQNNEYTVNQLLDRLIQDDSWEKNPMFRAIAVGMLKRKLSSC